jgi:hypothetical protein
MGIDTRNLRADCKSAENLWSAYQFQHSIKYLDRVNEVTELFLDLFARANNLLDEADVRDIDTQNLTADYGSAEDLWEANQFYEAENLLEDVITRGEQCIAKAEITEFNWFDVANETIQTAEREGRNREVLFMKAYLDKALTCWDREDYVTATIHLEKIVLISEPIYSLTLLGLCFFSIGNRKGNDQPR